jgi:hypothetical protein
VEWSCHRPDVPIRFDPTAAITCRSKRREQRRCRPSCRSSKQLTRWRIDSIGMIVEEIDRVDSQATDRRRRTSGSVGQMGEERKMGEESVRFQTVSNCGFAYLSTCRRCAATKVRKKWAVSEQNDTEYSYQTDNGGCGLEPPYIICGSNGLKMH